MNLIESKLRDGYQIFYIHHHIDRNSEILNQLQTEITHALDNNQLQIAISINTNSYLYSEVIAKIITIHEIVASKKGTLFIIINEPHILSIFETLGLSDLLNLINYENELPFT